jgi:hypothetical protein
MGIATRIRSILWAEGPHYIGIYLGLVALVMFVLFPCLVANGSSIYLLDYYVNSGKTWNWLNALASSGQLDTAIALLVVLVSFPFIFWWTYRNKPVIMGLLCILSGLLWIYVFKVSELRDSLVIPATRAQKPFAIGVGTYGIILTGGLLVFLHFYFKRQIPEILAGILSRQKSSVQLIVRYLFLTGALIGSTAGAFYFYIVNYAVYYSIRFNVAYPWTLLLVGIGCVATGVFVIPSREADETGPSRMLITFANPEWYRYSRRGSLGKYSTPLVLTGITLLGVAFFLFWLWSI